MSGLPVKQCYRKTRHLKGGEQITKNPARDLHSGQRVTWPHRKHPLWTGCYNTAIPDLCLLPDPRSVKRLPCLRERQPRGHPSGRGSVQSGPRGPRELKAHSWRLRGGPLIACSSANWFSARSEPEWQRGEGGISCFCIYNSVASCER